jgi:sensor domain CHASE-containing protein
VIVFAMLVTLTSVELSLKFNQESDFNTGVSSIIQAYERHNLMAEINYRIRKLERIAVGWIQDPTGNLEWELRNDVNYLAFLYLFSLLL